MSTETGFDISHKLTMCLKGQSLFSGKNKEKKFNMLSAKNFTQSAKVKVDTGATLDVSKITGVSLVSN